MFFVFLPSGYIFLLTFSLLKRVGGIFVVFNFTLSSRFFLCNILVILFCCLCVLLLWPNGFARWFYFYAAFVFSLFQRS
jgi:hypothetical protein